MRYPQSTPFQRVGPGTADNPTITDAGNVIVRGELVGHCVQLDRSKRWVYVRDGGKVTTRSWPTLEHLVDELRTGHGELS